MFFIALSEVCVIKVAGKWFVERNAAVQIVNISF